MIRKRIILIPFICIIGLGVINMTFIEANQQNSTRLQARISLESKNLDLDEHLINEQYEGSTLSVPTNQTSDIHNSQTNLNSSLGSTGKKKRTSKKSRASRRLNNIWSMFLPSSDSSNEGDIDYEENIESTDDSLTDLADNSTKDTIPSFDKTDKSIALEDVNSVQKSLNRIGSASESIKTDQHDEKLVAKYSKLLKQNHTSLPIEFLLPSPASLTRNFAQQNQTLLNATTQSESLITGSLSNDIGLTSPNMNDILSNIMNSMSSGISNNQTGTTTDKPTLTESDDMLEREDDEKPPVDRRNKTDTADQFERWLNRIQSEDSLNPHSSLASTQPKLNFTLKSIQPKGTQERNTTFLALRRKIPLKVSNFSLANSQSEMGQPVETSTVDLNTKQQAFRQQQLFGSTKSSSMILPPVTGKQQVKFTPSWSTKTNQNAEYPKAPVHSNPIQQATVRPFKRIQLRQNPLQLVQGIKHPSAEASTISVNTHDGTSNTSLSFASHHLPMIESNNNVNSSIGLNLNQTKDQLNENQFSPAVDSMQTAELQSQDEILRQVTSAINFEQQLHNKKAELLLEQKSGSEPIVQSLMTTSDESSNASHSKMSNKGSNHQDLSSNLVQNYINQSQDPSINITSNFSSTSTSFKDNAKNQVELLKTSMSSSGDVVNVNTSALVGLEDVDKSFDNFTDKLKVLAALNSSSTNSQDKSSENINNQPSWLRRPNIDLISGNFSKLASLVEKSNVGKTASSLEQLRELFNKHERNKNELKNSEESMNTLLKQLLQSSEGEKVKQVMKQQNSGEKESFTSNVSVKGKASSAQKQVGKALVNKGWTPLNQPISAFQQAKQTPISPAKRMKKQRVKQAFHISQAQDNVGSGKDFLRDDEFSVNDLAKMFENSKVNFHSSEMQNGERLLGLPIAILKEEEEEEGEEPAPARLEQAVEHLLYQHQNQPHLLRHSNNQQFATRLAGGLQGPPEEQLQKQQIQRQQQQQQPASFLHTNIPSSGLLLGQNHPASAPQQLPGFSSLASLLQDHQQKQQHQQDSQQLLEQHQPYKNLLQSALSHANNLVDSASPLDALRAVSGLAKPSVPDLLRPESLLPKIKVNPQRINEIKHQIEELQRAQQVNSENLAHEPIELKLQRQAQNTQAAALPGGATYPPPRTALPHEVGLRAPLVAASLSSGGPPVRFREISVYRPFGYESHHAIAYQASPTLAALFPGLAQSGRPSVLRHMTPFRAIQTQRGLINPIMSPTQLSNTIREQQQSMDRYKPLYAAASSYMNDEPSRAILPYSGQLPSMSHPHYLNADLLKRHSRPTFPHEHSLPFPFKEPSSYSFNSPTNMVKPLRFELNQSPDLEENSLIEREIKGTHHGTKLESPLEKHHSLMMNSIKINPHPNQRQHHLISRRDKSRNHSHLKTLSDLENMKRSRKLDEEAAITHPSQESTNSTQNSTVKKTPHVYLDNQQSIKLTPNLPSKQVPSQTITATTTTTTTTTTTNKPAPYVSTRTPEETTNYRQAKNSTVSSKLESSTS